MVNLGVKTPPRFSDLIEFIDVDALRQILVQSK
jgi:hypothetical protein